MTTVQAQAAEQPLHVQSKFVTTDVNPRDIVRFADGLPGYETVHEFVLLDVPGQAPLKVLHAVNGGEPSFLVIDPKAVLSTYRCELGAPDRLRLGAADDSGLVWLAIVMVGGNGDVSINLRAPIVINPARMTGRQVMPNACVYPLRYVVGR
jgi:flagellar assembly factor FliW